VDRPLWQIVLCFLLLLFGAQRGAEAAMGFLAQGPRALTAGYGASALAAALAALGIWLGRTFALAAVIALGVTVAATAILEGATVGAAAFPASATQVIVAALGAGALVMALRHELQRGSDGGGRP
jgi:hypothetical protein